MPAAHNNPDAPDVGYIVFWRAEHDIRSLWRGSPYGTAGATLTFHFRLTSASEQRENCTWAVENVSHTQPRGPEPPELGPSEF
ncbi:ankyrin [Anopheles sinensis]|uniref:Ankyrin n=1 Tax=Anopheles sinensis TaxID=74873 RepID=A0A084WGU2_ANOSI|nr:ankyrin [Anopheles sinensis]